MRVLHVLRVLHPEGAGVQSYLASAAAALEQSPVQLAIGALWPGMAPAYRADVRHMGQKGRLKAVNIWAFWRWLRRDVPEMDLIHIHNVFGLPLLLGALACRLAGVPYVVSPHGRLVAAAQSEMDWRHRVYLRLVALPMLRRAALLIVTTESDREDLACLDAGLKVAVIRPGIPFSPPAQVAARQDGGLRIVFVGRLLEVKNVPTLLQAAALLRDRRTGVAVDIVGWSTDGTDVQLRAQVEQLGLRSLVNFHGKLHGEARDRIMQAARVAAIPSLRENFSFVTAEALTLGIPVVVSASIGLAPLITQYRCGVVVPATDASAWADALQLFEDPAAHLQYVHRALECARREFSTGAMRDALVTAYRTAQESGNSRSVSGT